MQPNHFEPRVLGHSPHFEDAFGRHLAKVKRFCPGRKRKRCDLNSRVTEFADCGKHVGEWPVAEHLVANGEFHEQH